MPEGSPLPPVFNGADLRAAALTFPADTGTGADNVSPRAYARLSDALLQELALLLLAMERKSQWAPSLQIVLIVLLPKAGGGRRPIGLMPGIVRLWPV